MRVEIPSSSATALTRKIITYAIYNTEPISKSLKTLHIQNIIKPPSLYLPEISDHFVKQRKCIMCLLQVKKMEKTERKKCEPLKDGGFSYWNKANTIDALIMHLISLSAIKLCIHV